MARPDFLIIGAQKCATSWLHYQLRQHGELFLPEEKDVEFFSYSENLTPIDFGRWLERFACEEPVTRTGDANAAYFWTETGSSWSNKPNGFNRHIPEAVQAYLGDELQLIVSLRSPVERAVSAYLHHIHHGAVSPEQVILDIPQPLGIVDMGFYAVHLKNWLDVYPAENFLVIEGLPASQEAAVAAVDACTSFLGVRPFPEAPGRNKPVYPGLARLWREDGVWVEEQNPAIVGYLPLQRNVPVTIEAGRRFARLVDPSELERLRAIFAGDHKALRALLTSQDIRCVDLHMLNASTAAGGDQHG